jgi:hypothetical protein
VRRRVHGLIAGLVVVAALIAGLAVYFSGQGSPVPRRAMVHVPAGWERIDALHGSPVYLAHCSAVLVYRELVLARAEDAAGRVSRIVGAFDGVAPGVVTRVGSRAWGVSALTGNGAAVRRFRGGWDSLVLSIEPQRRCPQAEYFALLADERGVLEDFAGQ